MCTTREADCAFWRQPGSEVSTSEMGSLKKKHEEKEELQAKMPAVARLRAFCVEVGLDLRRLAQAFLDAQSEVKATLSQEDAHEVLQSLRDFVTMLVLASWSAWIHSKHDFGEVLQVMFTEEELDENLLSQFLKSADRCCRQLGAKNNRNNQNSDFSHETCAESDSERSSADEMATTKLLACQPGVDLQYLAEVFLAAHCEGVYSARKLRDIVTKLLLKTRSIQTHDDFSEVLQEMFGNQLNEKLRSQFVKRLDHCRGYTEETVKARRGGDSRLGSSLTQMEEDEEENEEEEENDEKETEEEGELQDQTKMPAVAKLRAFCVGADLDLRCLAQAFLQACCEVRARLSQENARKALQSHRDFVTMLVLDSCSDSIHSKHDFRQVLQLMFTEEELDENLLSQFLKSVDHCCRQLGTECLQSVKKNKRGGRNHRRHRN